MRLFLSGFTLLVALVLLAPVGDAAGPTKPPKPPDYVSASVAFRDSGDDAIMSDGGPYEDGKSPGLAVLMWTCPSCTQDLTLNTQASSGGLRRKIFFSYTPATDVQQPPGTLPDGESFDDAFFVIRDIAAMAVDETKLTFASFATPISEIAATGYFRWLGAPPPLPGWADDSYGSQAVKVTRSVGPAPTYYPTWTVNTVPSVGYEAGDLSALLRDGKRNTKILVGLYHMPFGLTVTCPSCQ